ncbi:MAG: transcription termination factor Rho [Lachnospiraceae bacterium]|nr:transcription termination factor Rho [Lachnospiraceae bacterium]
MKEKYESLSLAILKDLAKARGMKRISTLKKAELIERMLQQDELDAKASQSAGQENENQKEDAAPADSEQRPQTEASDPPYQEPAVQARPQDFHTRSNPSHQEPAAQNEQTAAEERPPREFGRNTQRTGGYSRENHQRTRPYKDTYHDNKPKYVKPTSAFIEESGDERMKTVDDRIVQKMESEGISMSDLDSGEQADGILEVMPDGYGFIRCENYLPGDQDVYVSPSQIRRFRLKTGDIIAGNKRVRSQGEKFSALLYITCVNDLNPSIAAQRTPFEDLTPIFPNERLRLETNSGRVSMRIMDLIAPVGKGQRGMIVSQPKAGKTTLLKEIATSVKHNNPEMHLIILLIDERPEEVTDIKEAIEGDNVEVIYSTFDELPEHHKRVSEMVIERAKRLVEHKHDVMILLDSITRLARAYNMVVPPSGRTLSGGLDPGALHMPKRFFGAARNMREGGSLTILATALVDTGSRMDDVVYEEFKGTGNMELILDRKLSEKRIFPAIDIVKSGTRREDLLLNREEKEAVDIMRRALNGMKVDEAVESILRMFLKTRTNRDFINQVRHRKFF